MSEENLQAQRCRRIEELLREGLAATHVEVEDESHLHAGHAGARSGKGHFRVVVVSERFEGASRVEAQRLVFGALGGMMESDIHALAMKTFTPERFAGSQA